MTERQAQGAVAQQYAIADAKLADDPEWHRLCKSADREAIETPDLFLARNQQALYREYAAAWTRVSEFKAIPTKGEEYSG